ncbi:MAG: helicase, partial [Dehalococcoidia bacterium]|nr:helicase [Dehalococcoidia bacterium]
MNVSLQQYRDLLASYLWPQRGRVVLLAVFIFANLGLLLATPQILRNFIDTARAGSDLTTLASIALLFGGVALSQQVVSVLATYFSERVGWTATNALRSDVTRHCLTLDMSFHHKHTPGEMIERVDGDVNTLGTFFSTFAIQIVGSLLLLVGILVLLFREEWRAGLGLTVFAILSMALLLRLRNIAVPYWKATRQATADMFGFLEERLSGTEDIRSSNAQPYVLRRFYELTRAWLSRVMKSSLVSAVFWNTNENLWAVGSAAALALGAYLFLEQAITLGTVYLLFHYATMLSQPIQPRFPISNPIDDRRDSSSASQGII